MTFKCVKCGKEYEKGTTKTLWIGFCSIKCQNEVKENDLQKTVQQSEEYQHSKMLYKQQTPGVKSSIKEPEPPTRD